MEKISVIVPVYNAGCYLADCIESVLAQTYPAWELILVDDGSTDQSLALCQRYAEEQERICVIHQENAGVSAARNAGLAAATGDYLCFIDADDYVQDDYLATLHGALVQSGADVAFCSFFMQYGTRSVERALRVPAGTYRFAELSPILIDDGTLTGILFGSVCAALYRTAPIRAQGLTFNGALRINEDGFFNLQLLPQVGGITVVPYLGYYYRQWKTARRKSFGRNAELDKTTAAIAKDCKNYSNLAAQLQKREASAFFWTLLSAATAAGSFWKIKRELKLFLKEYDTAQLSCVLAEGKINRYKRLIMRLALRKQAFLLLIVIRYLYPLMRRFLKR